MKFNTIMEFIPHNSLALSIRDYYNSKQQDFLKLVRTYELITSSEALNENSLEQELLAAGETVFNLAQAKTKGIVTFDGDIVSMDTVIYGIIDYNTRFKDIIDVTLDKSIGWRLFSINGEQYSLDELDSFISETYLTNSVIFDTLTQIGNLEMDDITINTSDLAAILNSKYDTNNPNVSNIIYSVLNVISIRGASVKQKIEALLELLNPTVTGDQRIEFITLDGEYTGISPAASWIASLNLDFSNPIPAIVSAVKAYISVAKTVYGSILGFIKKGAMKLAQATILSNDVKTISGKRNLLYVPYKQGSMSLTDLYDNYRSRIHISTDSISFFGNISQILEDVSDISDFLDFKEYINAKIPKDAFFEIDYGFAVIRLFMLDEDNVGYMFFIGLIGQGRDYMEESYSLTLKKHKLTMDMGQGDVEYTYFAPDSDAINPAELNLSMYDPNEEVLEIQNNNEAYKMMRNSIFLLHNLMFYSHLPFQSNLRSHFRNLAETYNGFFDQSFTDADVVDYFSNSNILGGLPFKVFIEHSYDASVYFDQETFQDFYGDWTSIPSSITNLTFISTLGSSISTTKFFSISSSIASILLKLLSTKSSSQHKQMAQEINNHSIMLYTVGVVNEIEAKWNICTDVDNKIKFSNLLKGIGVITVVVGLAIIGLKVARGLKSSYLATNARYQDTLRVLGQLSPDDPTYSRTVKTAYKRGVALQRKNKLLNMLGIKPLLSNTSVAQGANLFSMLPIPGLSDIKENNNTISNQIEVVLNRIGQ